MRLSLGIEVPESARSQARSERHRKYSRSRQNHRTARILCSSLSGVTSLFA